MYLTSTYRRLADDLEVGQSVLFADGTVAMDVVDRGPGWARLKVTLPGQIRSHQGINVPRAGLSVAALDRQRPRRPGVDRGATRSITSGCRSCGRRRTSSSCAASSSARQPARIIAKIEKPQALANLDAIVAEADAVMVARGDLGVELDVMRVPAIQKQIIDACHRAGCR